MKKLAFLITLGVLSLPSVARAHDPGLSSLSLLAGNGGDRWTLTLAPSDAAVLLPKGTATDPRELSDQLAAFFSIELDGVAVTLAQPRIPTDDEPNIIVEARLERGGTRLSIDARDFFAKAPRGHRQYFTSVDPGGRLLHESLLDSGACRVELDRSRKEAATGSSFLAFLALGFEHILFGFDHLLFLAMLLLTVERYRTAAVLVTSFTAAHSATLALAVFDVVSVPAGIVEPLIAASIVWVAAENVITTRPRFRTALTFLFGLVHGLGFSSALEEAGVAALASPFAPLAAFNLGVEAGQLLVVLVVLPLIARLRQRASAPRWALFGAATALVVASFWLIERTVL